MTKRNYPAVQCENCEHWRRHERDPATCAVRGNAETLAINANNDCTLFAIWCGPRSVTRRNESPKSDDGAKQ